MSSRRRDVAGRAPAHREYPRNETQCRRSGRYPPPAGSLIAPAGTAVRSLARCPHPADTAGQVAHRAIVGRDHNADAPPAWSRVRTSPDHPPPPGYRRTRPEIPGMDDLRGSPAAPPPSSRDSVSTTASSLWATQDAAGAVANNDRREAHRCELSAAAQQAIFQLHPAAVVAPARPGRPSGYSRSMHRHIQRDHRPPLGLGHDFTATMNMPIWTCQPQLSLCVTTCPESGCSPSCLSAGSALLSKFRCGYIQSTAASVLYLSSSLPPAWRNN